MYSRDFRGLSKLGHPIPLKKNRAMGHQFEKHPRRHLFTGMYEVVIVAEFGAGLGFSNMAVSQM